MDNVAAMRFGERVDDLQRELERLIERKRAPAHEFFQRLAVDVLHHEEEHIFDFIDFVDRADVRMIDGGRGASFSQEPGAGFLVADEIGGERFDGDGAMELCILGLVDHTHPAFSNFLGYAVVEYGFSNHRA